MPYVQRNAQGQVVALLKDSGDSATEFLMPGHPDITFFLTEVAAVSGDQFSPITDLEMVRVIEDLVDLLIVKNVIVLTDLPAAVQKKLLRQRNRRSRLFGGMNMFDEGNDGLF
jgi:hypothetical protein